MRSLEEISAEAGFRQHQADRIRALNDQLETMRAELERARREVRWCSAWLYIFMAFALAEAAGFLVLR